MIQESWDQAVADGKMTAEQVDRMTAFMGGPAGLAISVVQQIIGLPLVLLLSALVVWFGVGFVLGTKFRFRLAFEVVCWASLITLPGQILTGIIAALVGRGDVIFSDRLNHASIIDGALLSSARLIRYPHNDAAALEALLKRHRGPGRALIVTDAVFSMDGDVAPLGELVELKKAYNALLMVDDAHGSGVLGEGGSGTAELLGVSAGVDILMGTFGKALGSFGAYAALSAELRALLVNRARSFIFSTSLPPSVLGASLAALKIVASPEGRRLREDLTANAECLRSLLSGAGFQLPEGMTQIIPVLTGEAHTTMRFSELLLSEGIFAQGIRPPTVPAGACRLRCTVMATHTRQDLAWAADRITSVGKGLGVI